MPSTTAHHFTYAHLPAHLQAASKPICDVALKLEASLPDSPEKSVAMRKLLEAKDCAVRAAVDAHNAAQKVSA